MVFWRSRNLPMTADLMEVAMVLTPEGMDSSPDWGIPEGAPFRGPGRIRDWEKERCLLNFLQQQTVLRASNADTRVIRQLTPLVATDRTPQELVPMSGADSKQRQKARIWRGFRCPVRTSPLCPPQKEGGQGRWVGTDLQKDLWQARELSPTVAEEFLKHHGMLSRCAKYSTVTSCTAGLMLVICKAGSKSGHRGKRKQ